MKSTTNSFFLLGCIFLFSKNVFSQTCYYYIQASPGNYIEKDVIKKRVVTNVFSAPCIDYNRRAAASRMEDKMLRQFNDALSIKFEKKVLIGNREFWNYEFETELEANKDRREVMSDLINDDYKIINFNFE